MKGPMLLVVPVSEASVSFVRFLQRTSFFPVSYLAMNLFEVQNECLRLLTKSIADLEELQTTIKPISDAFTCFRIQFGTFESGETPDSYKNAIRYAGAALHVYLRKFDGSKGLEDGIAAIDVSRIKTYEDYIAYVSQLGKITSPSFRPVCTILEKSMRKLSFCGASSRRLSADEAELKQLFDVFTPVESAFKMNRLALTGLSTIYAELQKEYPQVVFANPVYRAIMDHVVPAAAQLIDGVFNRDNCVQSLSVLSVEMRSLMYYDVLLSGIDGAACFYLMDLLSFNEQLKSVTFNTLTESSQNFLKRLLSILSMLIVACEFYELSLKPARVIFFERLGSQVASYDDFRAIRAIMYSLGRVNGCVETNIALASETAKNNERISNLSAIVRNLPHVRGSPVELGAESRNAAYILWNEFTRWLKGLIEERERRLRLEREDAMQLEAPNATSASVASTRVPTTQACWINSFLCA